jgi:hypothetical protein
LRSCDDRPTGVNVAISSFKESLSGLILKHPDDLTAVMANSGSRGDLLGSLRSTSLLSELRNVAKLIDRDLALN